MDAAVGKWCGGCSSDVVAAAVVDGCSSGVMTICRQVLQETHGSSSVQSIQGNWSQSQCSGRPGVQEGRSVTG